MPSSRHVVSTSAARDWASANQLSFFEVSAAPPGKDVESPFTWLAAQVHKAYEEKLRGYVDACRNY